MKRWQQITQEEARKYVPDLEGDIEKLQKKLDIATTALKKHQKAIKEFKKDPMNNLVMLSHQVIYDIDRDIKKALKEIDEVGTSAKEEE